MKHIGFIGVALAVALAQPAAADWNEASSDHFVIYSQQSEKSLAEYAKQLELLDAAMRVRYQLKSVARDKANRLTVFVVDNDREIRSLMGKGSKDVMGYFIPRASGSVAFVPQHVSGRRGDKFSLGADTILFHEYAHHFFFQNFAGSFPLWFGEGFAEFFSTVEFEKNGAVGIGLPAAHRAYSLSLGRVVPIEKLLAAKPSDLSSTETENLYSRGWALLHMLTFDPDRKGQLGNYLNAVNHGVDAQTAAEAAFGDLKTLDHALSSYVTRPRLPYLKIDKSVLTTGPIEVRSLPKGEDEIMDVMIASKHGVSRTQALELVPQARAIAEQYRSDAFVQGALAEAEFDAGNYVEAEAAADRALAVEPQSSHALTYRAMAKMRLAAKLTDEDQRNAAWGEARTAIIAANRVDPDDPQPLVLYYRSFLEAGVAATENAKIGLVQAHSLAPGDHNLTMNTALMYLRDGKIEQSRKLLLSLAYDAHGGSLGKVATKMLADIDAAGDDKAAIARIVSGKSDVSESDEDEDEGEAKPE